jgi:sulfite reductase beta subunit-like hemoprotein
VQEDAARLASCLPVRAGVLVHVSGCAKGCAHAQAAPVTLVGRDGEYDLVRDGKADGVPSLRGLWSAALAAALASWPDFDQIAASPVRPAAHREPVC